jgi:hypothetical protein
MSVKDDREEFVKLFLARIGQLGNASRTAEFAAICVQAGVELDRLHNDSWEIPWRRIIDRWQEFAADDPLRRGALL